MGVLPEELWSPIQATDWRGQYSLFHQLQTDNWMFIDMEKKRKRYMQKFNCNSTWEPCH